MNFFDAVRSSIGADAVDVSDEARLHYGHNRLPGGDRRVDAVVTPASTDDVAAVVRLAGEQGVTAVADEYRAQLRDGRALASS